MGREAPSLACTGKWCFRWEGEGWWDGGGSQASQVEDQVLHLGTFDRNDGFNDGCLHPLAPQELITSAGQGLQATGQRVDQTHTATRAAKLHEHDSESERRASIRGELTCNRVCSFLAGKGAGSFAGAVGTGAGESMIALTAALISPFALSKALRRNTTERLGNTSCRFCSASAAILGYFPPVSTRPRPDRQSRRCRRIRSKFEECEGSIPTY